MRLGILGPLLVTDAKGKPSGPRGFKLRALLGNFLVGYGGPVATQDLLAELWGGSSPPAARNALQVAVSSLRKYLQEAGLVPGVARLVTLPGGYMMELDEREFDLPCFQSSFRRARAAQDRGRLDEAAHLMEQACVVWRGRPLSDIRGTPSLDAEARRLNELRIAAHEARIAIDLQRGRAGDVIGEIYALVAKNPFRERLYEYLMIALHTQGRSAEALDAYRMIRSALHDKLGMEPGPNLRELQRMVLCQDLLAPSYPARLVPG